MDLLVPILCATVLVALISALIISDKFRHDILAHEGEASFLGIMSVKGVVVVVLCGLFLTGLIYSTNRNITNDVVNIDTLPLISQAQSAALEVSETRWKQIQKELDLFFTEQWEPYFSSAAVKDMNLVNLIREKTTPEEASQVLITCFGATVRHALEARKEWQYPLDEAYRREQAQIRNYYQQQSLAAASGDSESLNSLIKSPPDSVFPLIRIQMKLSEITDQASSLHLSKKETLRAIQNALKSESNE